MLEALTTTQDTGGFTTGDVICVGLIGTIWGTEEVQVHSLVQFEDQDLEDRLNAIKDAGDENPIISYPYETFELVDTPKGKRARTVYLSSKYVEQEISLPNHGGSTPNHGGPSTPDTPPSDDIPVVTLLDK